MPKDVHNTPFVFVKTEEQLDSLLEELKKETMFSVDLEYHSFRSYLGFVCLMQISTASKDFLIDTLLLRHKMYILNEVFTKPDVLKIFHGATNDIEWLQKDFNLYVVGMFDTYSAAKILGYSGLSLEYLLKRFCDINANKKFQLLDWRIRPLPDKAIQYAREDTHYLLYIYKKMANELLEKGMNKTQLLEVAFQNSCETCQRVFMKPIWNQNSHMSVYIRAKRHFDNRQLYALKELFKWRDTIAREEDESTGYVLPNHMLLQICQTLPRELQGVLGCCNPIPPLVRQHALAIHQIILRAKEQPLEKSVTEMENISSKSSQFSVSRDVDLEIRLNTYVHDTANIEFRDDLPTLLDGTLPDLGDPPEVKPKLSLLVNSALPADDDVEELTKAVVKIHFIPPYERYKKILPYSIQQEKEEQEKEKKLVEDRMEKSTEKQYATPAKESSPSPRKRRAEDENNRRNKGSTPLIAQPGAQKKIKTVDISIPEEEVDSILPLINVDKKIKYEKEDEELENRIGSCGGSISSQKKSNPHQRLSGGPGDDRFSSTPSRGSHSPRGRGGGPSPRGRGGPSPSGRHANSSQGTSQGHSRSNQGDSRRNSRSSQGDYQGQTSSNATLEDEGFTPFDYGSVNFNKFLSSSSGKISMGGSSNKRGGKNRGGKNRQFRGKQFNKGKRGGQRGAGGKW
uniref:Exosome component 10 n=1 Tax=Lygus hesperus TaxID=30085 RepID=A0A0A9XS26_LYGHE